MALNRNGMPIRPGQALGLFFALTFGAFVIFVAWEAFFSDSWQLFGQDAPCLSVANWLVLIATMAAITGWVVAASITIRNSIKQHSINTLLQSRLSTAYMQRADVINSKLFAPGMPLGPLPLSYWEDPENSDIWLSVEYVLNYFEFLAVGIRHGDLDEPVLRNTLRGIVVRLFDRASPLIESSKLQNPRSKEHLTWLYDAWKEGKK